MSFKDAISHPFTPQGLGRKVIEKNGQVIGVKERVFMRPITAVAVGALMGSFAYGVIKNDAVGDIIGFTTDGSSSLSTDVNMAASGIAESGGNLICGENGNVVCDRVGAIGNAAVNGNNNGGNVAPTPTTAAPSEIVTAPGTEAAAAPWAAAPEGVQPLGRTEIVAFSGGQIACDGIVPVQLAGENLPAAVGRVHGLNITSETWAVRSAVGARSGELFPANGNDAIILHCDGLQQ